MITAIDFGASATKAAARSGIDDDPHLVLIDQLPESPTAVFLTRRRELVVGRAAVARAQQDPLRFYAGLKQQINRPDETEPTHQEILLGRRETQPLIRAVGRILRHAFEASGADAADHVVLSHPVHWHESEKAILIEAAALQKLPPVSLIPEPTAIAQLFAADLAAQLPVAVFDLGASTLDIAIVRRDVTDKLVTVYSDGRVFGGDDFDGAVLDLVLAALPADQRAEFVTARENERYLIDALIRDLKQDLSTSDSATLGFRDFETCEIQRYAFEEHISGMLTGGLGALDRAMQIAAASTPVKTVLLSGGACHTPLVRERAGEIAERFGADLVFIGSRPEAHAVSGAVALGAVLTQPPLRPAYARPRTRFRLSAQPVITLDVADRAVALSPGLLVASGAYRLRYAQSGRLASDLRTTYSKITSISGDPHATQVVVGTERGLVERWSNRGRDSEVFGSLTSGEDDEAVTAVAAWRGWTALVRTSGAGGLYQGMYLAAPLRTGLARPELAFTRQRLLLAWAGGRLRLLDPLTSRCLSEIHYPVDALVTVGEDDEIAIAADGVLSCHQVAEDGISLRWQQDRDVRAAGFTGLLNGPALVVYDRTDDVYRALRADTGASIAVCDVNGRPPAEQIIAGAGGDAVYARCGRAVYALEVGV